MARFLHEHNDSKHPIQSYQTGTKSTLYDHMTKDLKKAVKRKLKLFKQAKLLKTEKAWYKYTSVRNKVLSALRSAKSNFFKNLANKLKSSTDFWSAYHKLSPPKNRITAELKHNNFIAKTSL